MTNPLSFGKVFGGVSSFSSLHPWLYRLSTQKEVMVADILSISSHGLSWNLTFLRELYDWEAQTLTSILDSLKDLFFSTLANDERIWTLESSRKFSSKSFFNALIELLYSSPPF